MLKYSITKKSTIGETIKKKRPSASFKCQNCNSTFDNRYSMKKHIEKQHGVKQVLSPKRKAPKTEETNVTLNKERPKIVVTKDMVTNSKTSKKQEEEDWEDMEEETVTVSKEHMENLQDLLVQTGQENEELKRKVHNSVENIQIIEEDKKGLETEVYNLKKVISTPILGIAMPVLRSEKLEL